MAGTDTRDRDLLTKAELRAKRLGFALRDLAADLVEERRKVAQLRREVAELRSREHPGGYRRARSGGVDASATSEGH
jgi:hypothetical protein